MGAFTDIFGKVPRVAILEILAENSDDELTIREIIDETEVSKRGVYLIIRDFIKNGLVLESGKRPKKYRLNKNDLRALTLIKAIRMNTLSRYTISEKDICAFIFWEAQ